MSAVKQVIAINENEATRAEDTQAGSAPVPAEIGGASSERVRALRRHLPDERRAITHHFQVNPLHETRAKVPGCRSLSFARTNGGARCSMSPAEQAEAGSAGEQPAKEYSAGNSSRRWGSGGSCRPPGLTAHIGARDFLMPKKTHLGCGYGSGAARKLFSNCSGER